MRRVCSDLLHAFFSLQRDYNKKEGTPSWQEPVPSFQNTSQRKYPNIMIRIFNLFCKLKNIKISDQEWFDRAIAKFNLSEHGNEQLFASKYKLYLPTKEELKAEIETQKAMFYLQQQDSKGKETE